MLLWQMMSGIQTRSAGKREMLDKLRYQIVDGLEVQGFDARVPEEVFDDLAKRYSSGIPPFRRKLHLNPGVDETE